MGCKALLELKLELGGSSVFMQPTYAKEGSNAERVVGKLVTEI